jgi:hypothetical protein
LKNIQGIHKIYGKYKIKSFPTASTLQLLFYEYFKGIKMINILNYVHYNKEKARKILETEFGWRYYGEKHYESNMTKFYQAYILPQKFGIDKRKAHYSSLICSGQMNRDEALALMRKESYVEEDLQRDKTYFLEKLEITDQEFEGIMRLPVNPHLDYPSDEKLVRLLRTGRKLIRHLFSKYESKL